MGKIEGGDARARNDMVTLVKETASVAGSDKQLAERRRLHIILSEMFTPISLVLVRSHMYSQASDNPGSPSQPAPESAVDQGPVTS